MIEARIKNNTIEVFVSDKDKAREIMDSLSAFEPGFEHNTLYRMGKWDGKKKFYKIQVVPGGWFFKTEVGFKKRLEDLLNISIPSENTEDFSKPLEFFKEVLMAELPFKPYKHQLKLFLTAAESKAHLGVSSVGCLDPGSKIYTEIDNFSKILLYDYRLKRKNKSHRIIESIYNQMKEPIKKYEGLTTLNLNQIFAMRACSVLVHNFLTSYIGIRNSLNLDTHDNSPDEMLLLFYKFLSQKRTTANSLQRFITIGLTEANYSKYNNLLYQKRIKTAEQNNNIVFGSSEFALMGSTTFKTLKNENP